MLAIGWSDGVVRLVGAESSKNVHQIAIGAQESASITCLGWVSNSTGKKKAGSGMVKDGSSWKDILEGRLDEQEGGSSLDLPRDLSLIDIESSMPKLSALPTGGTS
jgi:anaphase-promoting complex subunit 4